MLSTLIKHALITVKKLMFILYNQTCISPGNIFGILTFKKITCSSSSICLGFVIHLITESPDLNYSFKSAQQDKKKKKKDHHDLTMSNKGSLMFVFFFSSLAKDQ